MPGSLRRALVHGSCLFIWLAVFQAGGRPSGSGSILQGEPPPRFELAALHPAAGAREVARSTPISAEFSEAIDPSSVDSETVSVRVDGDPFPGDRVVSGPRLRFVPGSDWPSDATVEITLGAALRSLDGGRLGKDHVTVFGVTAGEGGNFRVLSIEPPAGASEVDPREAIVVELDRDLDPSRIQSHHLTLETPEGRVEGTVQAIGRFVVFQFEGLLKEEELHTVAFRGEIVAADGSVLDADLEWEFRTYSPLRVEEVGPPSGRGDVDPETDIVARLNRPVDPASVDPASFVVLDGLGAEVSGQRIVEGDTIRFEPDLRLVTGWRYTVVLEDSIEDLRRRSLVGGHLWTFDVQRRATLELPPLERVSRDFEGGDGRGGGESPVLSQDGRWITFASNADGLVPDDRNGAYDVFVHDRVTGRTERVSVSSSGLEGNRDSLAPSMSDDGRTICFISRASNLVSGDTDDWWDVFVHDRGTGETRCVSVDAQGAHTPQSSFQRATLSKDGRSVFWDTQEPLLPEDTNGKFDVYRRDLVTDGLERVSLDARGGEGDDDSFEPAVSADGRFVAFLTFATNLFPLDGNATQDVVVKDRLTGAVQVASVTTGGAQANGLHYTLGLSPDGRFVVFTSSAPDLVPSDTNGFVDAFLHDRATGETTRISVDHQGRELPIGSWAVAVSDRGRYVAFLSPADGVLPEDVNGAEDLFIRDRQTNRLRLASARFDRTAADFSSAIASFSSDGRWFTFSSHATNILPEPELNGVPDVYVRDMIAVLQHGRPRGGERISFEVTNAVGETGNLALVLLSASGLGGIPLPGDRREVPLTFDALTRHGLSLGATLRVTINALGTALTRPVALPPLPSGLGIHAAAVTIDTDRGAFISVTEAIRFEIE